MPTSVHRSRPAHVFVWRTRWRPPPLFSPAASRGNWAWGVLSPTPGEWCRPETNVAEQPSSAIVLALNAHGMGGWGKAGVAVV